MTAQIGHNLGPGEEACLVRVILPAALLRLFPEAPAELGLKASTVSEMLNALDERWPGMRDRLADTSPAIRRHISIFVDGHRAALDTKLKEDTVVYVMTSISGG